MGKPRLREGRGNEGSLVIIQWWFLEHLYVLRSKKVRHGSAPPEVGDSQVLSILECRVTRVWKGDIQGLCESGRPPLHSSGIPRTLPAPKAGI